MITVDIDDREVLDTLQRLIDRAGNPAPALKQIGEQLAESTKLRFRDGEAPDGTPWALNSDVTTLGYLGVFKGSHKKDGSLSRKGATRAAGKKPLIGETKSLSTTITRQVSGNEVAIGSPMEYASTHQFGARQGQIGRNRRGGPIPWGDIPARPFLGLSESDRTMVLDVINDYLSGPS
jgi:phage virion morphogenesis protein